MDIAEAIVITGMTLATAGIIIATMFFIYKIAKLIVNYQRDKHGLDRV